MHPLPQASFPDASCMDYQRNTIIVEQTTKQCTWASPECVVLVHKLHGAMYLNLKKNKILKKFLDVANCIHHDCANLQFEILCIMSSAKITKS
jgi:hypothetical protein